MQLENGYRAFVQLFCRSCGSIIKTNGDVAYCPNRQCKERATALKVMVKVVTLKPVSDRERAVPTDEAQ